MLTAYPAGWRKPALPPLSPRAILFGIAARDDDPAPDVRGGGITQAAADFACNLRPSVAAERAAGKDEVHVRTFVFNQVDAWLGRKAA